MASATKSPFQDEVILVTGGGSGIGRGLACAFAAEGARVCVTGRRAEPLDETVALITKSGGTASAICGDVSKPDDCRLMIAGCISRFGKLNVLINNAGIARYGALDQMNDGDIVNLININLLGTVLMTRNAIPELIKQTPPNNASILNISTSAALNPIKNFSVYTAAKAGVIHFTQCLALELSEHHVRVNCINPGVVETPIFETMMPSAAVKHAMAGFAKQTPLGRVGAPKDICEAALYLCGPNAAWVTGASLTVDGGISLV